jgi:hypothetical protein
MAKKKRSAAQRAATKKMLAARAKTVGRGRKTAKKSKAKKSRVKKGKRRGDCPAENRRPLGRFRQNAFEEACDLLPIGLLKARRDRLSKIINSRG